MYDLHAHILPGVDDGAKTPEDTLEMVRVAADHATRVIVATPHQKDITENWSVPHIRRLLGEVNTQIESGGLDVTLLLGMENHLALDLPDELSSGRALTIADSRYVLVELPFFGRPNYAEEVLFQLQVQGFAPVIAHPERIELFQLDPEILKSFVIQGMLSQVTAGSIVGHFGERVRRFTDTLLRRGLVHVIASDTHAPGGPRSPRLPAGVAAAAKVVGVERAQAMVVDTPRAIIYNLPVRVDAPAETNEQPRRWWRFWNAG